MAPDKRICSALLAGACSAVVIVAVPFGLWLQSVGRYIAKGNSYYTKRAYEEALRTYQIGLHRHPGNSVLQEKIKQTLDAIARKNQIDALIKQSDSYYARVRMASRSASLNKLWLWIRKTQSSRKRSSGRKTHSRSR